MCFNVRDFNPYSLRVITTWFLNGPIAHERDDSGLVPYFRFNDVLQYNYSNMNHGITFTSYKEGASNTLQQYDSDMNYINGTTKIFRS